MSDLIIEEMTPQKLKQLIDAENADRDKFALTDDDIAPLKRYVEHGIGPGGFLFSVLTNDLCEAVARSDLGNRRKLFEYVQWLYNEAPSCCWGSREKVDNWLHSEEWDHEAKT